jgi:hypothetical protein
MALSPYNKPTTPYQPNGISQYVPIANRKVVKASWKSWVASWRTAYRNSTAYPAAFDYTGLYVDGS